MKTSLFKIGIMAVFASGILSGCSQEKTVDYTIEGMPVEGQRQNSGGKRGVFQFGEDEVWKDTWTLEIGEGMALGREIIPLVTDVHVDAQIRVPQTRQMSVIEVTEPEFNEEYKEALVKNIFDSGEIYYGDIAHLPRRDLEALHPDQIRQEQREILSHIDIESAGDTYTLAEEYNVNEYIGRYDGRLYNLSLEELSGEKCRLKQIVFTPQSLQEVCPEKYKDWENLACTSWVLGDHVENECRLSEEDARKEALLFIKNLGLDYPVFSYSRPLVWGNPEEILSLTSITESESWSVNGYVFSFDLGVDDISFVDFGTEDDYKHPWYYGSEWAWLNVNIKEATQYSLNTRLEIYITDQGIVRMVANNPMEIIGVSEGVELLPLDTIKGILKEELEKNWKFFRIDFTEISFDGMELIYFRVQDKENPGKYSYVPVWRLCNVIRDPIAHQIIVRNPVLINAIDGTVIDFYNEVYHVPPVEAQEGAVL